MRGRTRDVEGRKHKKKGRLKSQAVELIIFHPQILEPVRHWLMLKDGYRKDGYRKNGNRYS